MAQPSSPSPRERDELQQLVDAMLETSPNEDVSAKQGEKLEQDQSSVTNSPSMPVTRDAISFGALGWLRGNRSDFQIPSVGSAAHALEQFVPTPSVLRAVPSVTSGNHESRITPTSHHVQAQGEVAGADSSTETLPESGPEGDFFDFFTADMDESSRKVPLRLSQRQPLAKRGTHEQYRYRQQAGSGSQVQYSVVSDSHYVSDAPQPYGPLPSLPSMGSTQIHERSHLTGSMNDNPSHHLSVPQGSHPPVAHHVVNESAHTEQQNCPEEAKPSDHFLGRRTARDRGLYPAPASVSGEVSSSRVQPQVVTSGNKGNKSRGKKEARDVPPTRDRHADTGLFFNNYEEATSVSYALDWSYPKNDSTLPKTDADRHTWIKKLVEAFKNRDGIEDKLSGKVVGSRWLSTRHDGTYCDYYGEDNIERICWNLLDTVIKMYSEGLHWIPVSDQETWDQGWKERGLTFEERMNALIQLLTLFKNRCDKMMKAENTFQTILAPLGALNTAHTNRIANDIRHKTLQFGRQAQKEGTQTETSVEAKSGKRKYNKKNRQPCADSTSTIERQTEGTVQANHDGPIQAGTTLAAGVQHPDTEDARPVVNPESSDNHTTPAELNAGRLHGPYSFHQGYEQQRPENHNSLGSSYLYNNQIGIQNTYQRQQENTQALFPPITPGGYAVTSSSRQRPLLQRHLQAPTSRAHPSSPLTAVNHGANLPGAYQGRGSFGSGGYHASTGVINAPHAMPMPNNLLNTLTSMPAPSGAQTRKRGPDTEWPDLYNGGSNDRKRRHGRL